MPSIFTPNLNLEKIADGEQEDTWGVTQRANQDKLDDLVAGYLAKSVAGATNVTLSEAEYDHRQIDLTGALTGSIDVIFPAVERVWHVYNNTSGAFTITLKVSGQTGFTAVQGKKYIVSCNGTDTSIRLSDETVAIAGGGTGEVTAAAAIAALGGAALATANTFTEDQTIQSTDAGADIGPLLNLLRNSASPAPSDALGAVVFQGMNDAGTPETIDYARITTIIDDETDGTEDATLYLQTTRNNVLNNRLLIGDGLTTIGATGGDQGADTINADEYYRNGTAIGLRNNQVFTGDDTYTPTSGMIICKVRLVGGGGGGGGTLSGDGSGGGGGGGYAEEILTAAEIGASQAVTVGAAGTAGAAAGTNNGGSGGTTSLGSLLSATGGAGGISTTALGAAGGSGGAGSGGDINIDGSGGGHGMGDAPPEPEADLGGHGGNSMLGGGGKGQSAATGEAGGNYGGGGGGGSNGNAGGAGAAGVIIIEEYF